MVPPGIGPGSCPRQGHVLAIGLWDLITFLYKKYLNMPVFLIYYERKWSIIFYSIFNIRSI